MIAIIDYGMGNVGSIKNMFSRIGVKSVITSKEEDILICDGIVLPGVGAFDKAINNLSNLVLFKTLNEIALNNIKPILGICLGMQIMAKFSEEGTIKGLGWFDAKVKKFDFSEDCKNLKIPHMGWNNLILKKKSKLISDENIKARYYFVHSYYFSPNESKDILAMTEYGPEFACAIEKGNLFGVQFHPEKSHKYGMKILKNFSNII